MVYKQLEATIKQILDAVLQTVIMTWNIGGVDVQICQVQDIASLNSTTAGNKRAE